MRHWSDDEREESQAFLDDAMFRWSDLSQRDRSEAIYAELVEAQGAGAFWPANLLHRCAVDGLMAHLKRYERNRLQVVMSFAGRKKVKSRLVGGSRRDDSGAVQGVLFDIVEMTWVDLRKKRDADERNVVGLRSHMTLIDRLLELEGRAEGATPQQVLATLGITLDAYLDAA